MRIPNDWLNILVDDGSCRGLTLTQTILHDIYSFTTSPSKHKILYDIAAGLYALRTQQTIVRMCVCRHVCVFYHVLGRWFDLLSIFQPFNLDVRIDHFTPQDYFLAFLH